MNNVNKLKPKKNLAGMHAHMQACKCVHVLLMYMYVGVYMYKTLVCMVMLCIRIS